MNEPGGQMLLTTDDPNINPIIEVGSRLTNLGDLDIRQNLRMTNNGEFYDAGTTTIAASRFFELGGPANTLSDQLGAGDITGPGRIEFNGTMNLEGDSISVNNVYDFSQLLTGSADLVINGEYRWIGSGQAVWRGGGTARVQNGAILKIMAGSAFDGYQIDGRDLVNDGTVVWTASRSITLKGGANIINQPVKRNAAGTITGGVFDVEVDETLKDSGTAGVITNYGNFIKTAGTGTATIEPVFRHADPLLQVDKEKAGVGAGRLKFTKPAFTGGGKVEVAQNATIEFDEGFTQTTDGEFQLDGNLIASGSSVIGGGTFTVPPHPTNDPAVQILNGSLLLSGGSMSLQARMIVSGEFDMSGGVFTVAPPTATTDPFVQIFADDNGGGGNFELTGGTTSFTLANMTVANHLDLLGGSLMSYGSGGMCTFTAAHVTIDTYDGYNYGTLGVVGGLTIDTDLFDVNGTIDLRAGPDMGGLQVYNSAGGDGMNFIEHPHSDVLIGIVSASASSSYDVHGSVALSGATEVALADGYTPPMGTYFYLINGDVFIGNPGWVLPQLPQHYYWQTGGADDGRDHDYLRVMFSYY